jgi:hypothetical protein
LETDVSEVRTASIIRVTMKAVPLSVSTRLQGAVSQNAVIFILAAMKT